MYHWKKSSYAAMLLAGMVAFHSTTGAQTKPPAGLAAKTETGYVASLKDDGMVLSNVPAGPAGGPARGGMQIQLGPGDVVRGPDGKMTLSPEAKKRFPPEQQKRIEAMLQHSPPGGEGGMVINRTTSASVAGGDVQIRLGPGDIVRGADGTPTLSPEARKRFTPEQVMMIEEDLKRSQPSGASTVTNRTVEGKDGSAPVEVKKAAEPGAPLKLTDFTFSKKTKKPTNLSQGDKVKVTYAEAGGKKVATRIEKAK